MVDNNSQNSNDPKSTLASAIAAAGLFLSQIHVLASGVEQTIVTVVTSVALLFWGYLTNKKP